MFARCGSLRGGVTVAKSFVRRAIAAGAVVGLVATGSLAAAGQQTAKAAGPVTLHFWMGPDTNVPNDTKQLVDEFNKANVGKIKVIYDVQSTHTDDYFNTIQRTLQNKGTNPDVFGGDVIWPAQLAGQGLLLPIDKYFPKSEQSKYLGGPIQDVQYKGQTYGAPWFTDFGLTYYRTDLLKKYNLPVPQTWQTLQSDAKTLVQKGAVKEGFVFQGNQYEGLVCNALEYVNGAGGALYPASAANSTATQAADGLAMMRGMITSGATPKAVTTYDEAATANDFTNGLAAFARNWPYMWGVAQGKASKIAGKVGVLPLMHSPGKTAYSTLGGWNLSISKYSQHPNEAWKFISFLISPAAQKEFAITEGHTMALTSTYNDPQVRKANPWFETVIPRLQIRPRPTSPVYNAITIQMQKDFHGVLDGSIQPSAAVKDISSYITVAESRFK